MGAGPDRSATRNRKRLGQAAELLDLPPRPTKFPVPSSNSHHPNGPMDSSTSNGPTSTRNGNGDPLLGSPTNGKLMTSPKPPEARSTVPASALNSQPGGSAEERVLASFQETMRVFLEVQRETMLAYLSARSGAKLASPDGQRVVAAVAPFPNSSPVFLPTAISDRIAARPAPAPAVERPPTVPAVPPLPLIPVAPTMVVPAVETEPTVKLDRDAVASRLVEIVRDRTGYPAEMLGLELDLEADLGIDSIKRVEILGSLRDSVAALSSSTDSSTMDSLSRAKTMGGIVDRVDEILRLQTSKPALAAQATASNGREPRPSPPVARSPESGNADADGDPDPIAGLIGPSPGD